MKGQSDSIKLSSPPGGRCFARTKENIQKVKRLKKLENYQSSTGISEKSVWRIMKNDLGRRTYKKVIEPLLSNNQTEKHLQIGFEEILEKRTR